MKEKQSLIIQLIKMAQADEQVRDEEYTFMCTIAGFMGVSKEQLDALFDEYIEWEPPPVEVERIVQFHRLVLLANVDLEVSEAEREMLVRAGHKLGLHPQAVKNVLSEMANHDRGMVPEDRLIEIFKVYHN